VVEAANSGELNWTHAMDRRLQNMIVASSNVDASWGTDLVGLLKIEKVMRDPKYCFYDDEKGGLWVGRPYRKGGASNRDPLHNISHGSTARQAARFYTMLDAGKLASPHWSFRMLGLMSPPKHFHKFVGGLQGEEGVVFLARKSGSWRNFHSDSALIQHFDRKYVIIGISELRGGEQVMRELVKVVDKVIAQGTHRKQRRQVSAKRNR
jgi:beta-lactamase class A